MRKGIVILLCCLSAIAATLMALAATAGCWRDENIKSDAVSALKGNPSSVRRPAGIQVVRVGRELGDHVEPGTVHRRGHELDAFLRDPE